MNLIEIIVAESFSDGERAAKKLHRNALVLTFNEAFPPRGHKESLIDAFVRNNTRLHELRRINTGGKPVCIVAIGGYVSDPYAPSQFARPYGAVFLNNNAAPAMHGRLIYGLWVQQKTTERTRYPRFSCLVSISEARVGNLIDLD